MKLYLPILAALIISTGIHASTAELTCRLKAQQDMQINACNNNGSIAVSGGGTVNFGGCTAIITATQSQQIAQRCAAIAG